MPIRSCFRGLAAGLSTHLHNPEYHHRFAHHRDRIDEIITTQVGLVADQDTIAGFFNGFLAALAFHSDDDTIPDPGAWDVLGGIYLLGAAAPTTSSAARGDTFLHNLATTLDAETPVNGTRIAPGLHAITTMFATTPDVMISTTTLSGFALGVLYAYPYLPPTADHPIVLLAAVTAVAASIAELDQGLAGGSGDRVAEQW